MRDALPNGLALCEHFARHAEPGVAPNYPNCGLLAPLDFGKGRLERGAAGFLKAPCSPAEVLVLADNWVKLTRYSAPGDGFVFYTDGVTEAENPAGEQYSLERLCQLVSRHWQQPAEQLKETVIEDVRHFIDSQRVFDDITLLVVKQR